MADIVKYIEDILQAEYGEEVRGSIAEVIKKVNDDNEKYLEIKESVSQDKTSVEQQIVTFKVDTEQRLDRFSQEYAAEVKAATASANNIVKTVETKLANGELTGSQGATGATGPQGGQGGKGDKGDTGEKGDKGDTGESGVTVPIGTGYFALSVEPADGCLYVSYNDNDKELIPEFELDSSTGDLYINIKE